MWLFSLLLFIFSWKEIYLFFKKSENDDFDETESENMGIDGDEIENYSSSEQAEIARRCEEHTVQKYVLSILNASLIYMFI